MKNYIMCLMVLMLVFLWGCKEVVEVNSFEDCVKVGNPVMESYPRKCRAGDKTFVEKIESEKMTIEEAIEITEGSECTEKGILTENYMYNDNSKTWWIDLKMKPEFENEMCYPACVVFEETKEVEINWRCTGALPPE